MKLRALDTRPPQTVRVTLDAATHEKLTVYLEYVRARGQHFADLKQLLAEIARAFVGGGDQEFLRWYRARTIPTALPTNTVNGSREERQPQVTQEASSPQGGAKGELEENAGKRGLPVYTRESLPGADKAATAQGKKPLPGNIT